MLEPVTYGEKLFPVTQSSRPKESISQVKRLKDFAAGQNLSCLKQSMHISLLIMLINFWHFYLNLCDLSETKATKFFCTLDWNKL